MDCMLKQACHKVCVCLTGLCVESAGVEEVSVEVDVHVTEEEKHVASLPGSGSYVQTPSSRKLFVQLQQSVVLKIHFPAQTQTRQKRWLEGETEDITFTHKKS